MADGKGESRAGLANGGMPPPPSTPPLPHRFVETLRALEDRLREDEVSVLTSAMYCGSTCEILLQHTEDLIASENVMLCADIYGTALRSFANARPYLTTECEDVLLLLGRLVLSCFEVVLSMTEDDFSCDPGVKFKKSVMESHDILVEFGNNNLQLLVDIVKNGGAWKNPVLVKILSQQSIQPEEVQKWISQEGSCFLQMRAKHLMKSNCIQQAMILSKLCSESADISNNLFFRQTFITCLCTMLPDEDAFKEISTMEGKEVLDTICNLESEGQDNTAFILCTTYLTQQLQNEITSCSWELTLFWSKLQRRIDTSMNTFLERCRQFGLIAKTLQHLFFLIKVVHTEAGDAGVPVSIMLCIRALQIQSVETDATKISVCKTIACLLPQDLEVRRACQLTEFLFEPTLEGLNILEELFQQPDQKNEEESSIISNSLRCELLLALKSHWVFDPEFWDWKTLKRHCLKILGKEVSDTEEEENYGESSANEPDILSSTLANYEESAEQTQESLEVNNEIENVKVRKPVGSSERYKRWLQYKFYCIICKREVIEARILHHAKMHLKDGVYTCPVCIKKFRKKEIFVPHVMEHMKMPMRHRPKKKNEHLNNRHGIDVVKEESDDEDGYMTFRSLQDKNLQDRDVYPCPGSGCSRVFKQFKYLSIHLKAEHQNNDENAKHYLDMKNMREKCMFCRRHFITSFHLKQHLKVHVDPEPFMCVSLDCNEKFKSINELLLHKQKHLELQYKCELKGCNLVFSDLGLLYHHEAQHFRDASYRCNFPGCKKFYYCISELRKHNASHGLQSVEGHNNGADVFQEIKSESQLLPCFRDPLPSVTMDKVCVNSPTFADRHLMSDSMQLVPQDPCCKQLDFSSLSYSHGEHVHNPETCLHHETSLECTCENENKGQVNFQGLRPPQFKQSSETVGEEIVGPNTLTNCTSSQFYSFNEEAIKTNPEYETKISSCDTDSEKVTTVKEECTEFPVVSAFPGPSASEDTLCELLTSLKHLNLKNSNTCIAYAGSQVQEDKASSSNNGETTKIPPSQKEKVLSQYLARLACKPYFCELKGCKYAFVTKDALLLHYVKKHHYTKEKALKLQMFQHKFSPFECHICQRSFTRRTHLRIHYRNKHHIVKEKVNCRPGRKKLDNPMQSCIMKARYTNCLKTFQPSETSSGSPIQRSPVQEDFNSEMYADSLSDETDASHGLYSGSRGDDFETTKGRGSRRVVAQGKLCYILNKYHKPFHCIHKSCNSSFTTQRGLVRHYRLVHQYSKESLCLEKDKEKSKREFGKCRRIFTCKYKECGKSFICARALSKHYREFHDHGENEDKELEMYFTENHLKPQTDDEEKLSEETESDESEICCDVEGCSAVFTNHINYSRHILARHRKYKHMEGRRKRGRPPTLRRVQEKLNESKPERRMIYRRKKIKVKTKAMKKEFVVFKTKEEALQMCALNVPITQFPCMVHGCASVVKLESSIIRHYKLTHHLSPAYVANHLTELVYCVKNFPGCIQEQISSEEAHSPRKRDCIPESKVPKLYLHGDVHSTLDQSDGYDRSPQKGVNCEVKDSLNYSPCNYNKTSQSCFAKSVSPKGSEKENLSFTHFQAACRRDKSEVSSQLDSSALSSSKEDEQSAFDLKTFKPMGFESSFLKFLQESKETDDEFEDQSDQYKHPHVFQNQMLPCKNRKRSEACLSQGTRLRHENIEGFRPLLSSSAQSAASVLTLQNLRTILDKALTDCGDLALKQLHYQRPVVVLERSKFTAPLIDLFSNKKTDELCVGFS
ncbi:zinc finger protein Rlf [Pelobates fuscus]|uniref:zinc finger protein Rlf n=1 Tax=Pelobates fuscus TaxID=191477 RepID=UPI002FE497F4